MRRPRAFYTVVLPAAALITMSATTWWSAHVPLRPDTPRLPVTPAARLSELTDEAVRLYAAGQFPRACERFTRAVDDEPSTARREDVARCFERWGWDTLRQGRPDEAMLLFRQGLHQRP